MSQSEPQESASDVPDAGQEPPPPVKEPWVWTPERVIEWNRYYDFYVAICVLLLVFIASAHLINNSTIWPRLQTGRLIAERGPLTTDPFSYTMEGKPWVNIPWLFDWLHFQAYELGRSLGFGTADQVAAGFLVGLTAFVRLATAWLLLQMRRPGPGLWWSALCTALALGVMVMPAPQASSPILPQVGGIAEPAEVTPEAWGILFLALEVWLLHRAIQLGKTKALFALVPLFILWANVDSWFLFGLIILGLQVVGLFPPSKQADRPRPLLGLGVLVLCVAGCLLNPSFVAVYPAAARPILRLFDFSTNLVTADQLSFFGPQSRLEHNRVFGGEESGGSNWYILYYVVTVLIGLAGFIVNRKRFDLGRFLCFAFTAVLWAALEITAPIFAVIWAATLALNGQEWYLDRFGVRGRDSLGWRTWSVGGRAVTLLALTAMMVKGLTGFGAAPAEPIFGFGVNEDRFPFESADFLADAKISGNVLNLNLATGDAIIWRSWPRNPARRPFIDSRENLYPSAFRVSLNTMIEALASGDSSQWKPLLDPYKISVVQVPLGPFTEPGRVYQALSKSPDWLPVYDDGNVVLFGRADAAPDDLAFFNSRRLEAGNLAFHVDRPVPPAQRPPTPTGPLDRLFPNRIKNSIQPHVGAARRWLTLRGTPEGQLPDAAHCLLAIAELRTALSRNPDDPLAWRLLSETYGFLVENESTILTEASGRIPVSYVAFRVRQRTTTLNYAIQATPPPESEDQRASLASLHRQLAELYLLADALDLARDQLAEAKRLMPSAWSNEDQTRFEQLEEHVQQVVEIVDRIAEETQANTAQLAEEARSRRCLGLAIEKLDEVAIGPGAGILKAQLLDLFCQAGWPDRAFELFDSNNVEDPGLNTGPGTSSYRQGMVHFLIGSYDVAGTLWMRAVHQLREVMGAESLEATRNFLRGMVREASETNQQLPEQLSTLTQWEIDLGLGLLEAGLPQIAGEHMEKALKLDPDLPARPLLAYYLDQMGRAVPPPGEKSKPDAASDTPPTQPELPENVFQKEPGDEKP